MIKKIWFKKEVDFKNGYFVTCRFPLDEFKNLVQINDLTKDYPKNVFLSRAEIDNTFVYD